MKNLRITLNNCEQQIGTWKQMLDILLSNNSVCTANHGATCMWLIYFLAIHIKFGHTYKNVLIKTMNYNKMVALDTYIALYNNNVYFGKRGILVITSSDTFGAFIYIYYLGFHLSPHWMFNYPNRVPINRPPLWLNEPTMWNYSSRLEPCINGSIKDKLPLIWRVLMSLH